MCYEIRMTTEDEDYLNNLPLSNEGRGVVGRFLHERIANVSDEFRLNPANRPGPANAPFFERELLFRDRWGNGNLYTVHFVLDDIAAAYGVLLLVWVDLT